MGDCPAGGVREGAREGARGERLCLKDEEAGFLAKLGEGEEEGEEEGGEGVGGALRLLLPPLPPPAWARALSVARHIFSSGGGLGARTAGFRTDGRLWRELEV